MKRGLQPRQAAGELTGPQKVDLIKGEEMREMPPISTANVVSVDYCKKNGL